MKNDERASLLHTLKLMENAKSRHAVSLLEREGLDEEIRAQGYATRGNNLFTNNPGKTSSIAVPIIHDGRIIAALTLVFFSAATKMTDATRQFVDPLKQAAEAIRHDLSSPRRH
jgi:IclR family mhp operon transcriptional activator